MQILADLVTMMAAVLIGGAVAATAMKIGEGLRRLFK